MSFKVLVIPEDPTHNGAVLKPLLDSLLTDAGIPSPQIQILNNPRVQGYDQAIAAIRGELVERYRWCDLWLFIPDSDRANVESMRHLEKTIAARDANLMCCIVQPEVEIYACAGYHAEISGGWARARQHHRFKEEVFPRLLALHGDPRRPSGGRDLMIAASLANLPMLYRLCPELKVLRDRIVEIRR